MIEFQFLRPLWLLMIIPAMVVLLLLWKVWSQRQELSGVCDPHLFKELSDDHSFNRTPAILWLATVWGLVIVLLAGPSWTTGPRITTLDDNARVILIDLSHNDSGHLEEILSKIVLLGSNPRTALVVFAEFPYVIAPFTSDIAMLSAMIPELNSEIMPVRGHRIDRAVQLANELLEGTNSGKGDILLVTDGAISAETVFAEVMGSGDRKLHIISFQDNAKLREQSQLFNGEMRIINDTNQAVDLAFITSENGAQLLPARRHESAIFLLFLLLPIVAVGFRRRNLASILLPSIISISLLSVPESVATATSLPLQHPKQAQAQVQAQGMYLGGDFEQAAEIWRQLDSIDAQFNLANALVQLGRYKEALNLYQSVLRLSPDAVDARFNYILLNEFLNEQNNNDRQEDEKEQSTSVENSQFGNSLKSEQENMAQNPSSVSETNSDSTSRQDTDGSSGNRLAEQLLERSELGQWLQKIPEEQGSFLKHKLIRQHFSRGYSSAAMETQ